MKNEIIEHITSKMKSSLDQSQYMELTKVLVETFDELEIISHGKEFTTFDNSELAKKYLSSKQIEGCSVKTINYYRITIRKLIKNTDKNFENITTDDLRLYLINYYETRKVSKVTLDNVRRILSTFFRWLDEENYILKNPIKRIHRVKTPRYVKETFTDEELEKLCANADIRELAILKLLISTGMRVGELVNLDIKDVNFNERECIVFGKGESERIVYFDASCKIHLQNYLDSRTDENPALFVSLRKPHKRLGINGVELCLKKLGKKCGVENVHPHKFRRTLATKAIDKGMPIEQVQKLLGHIEIDTTLRYAMVNQNNVKLSHMKYIS